jgi:hypothetical protein
VKDNEEFITLMLREWEFPKLYRLAKQICIDYGVKNRRVKRFTV